MLTLNVPDMTCGHCASTVTRTVKQVDATADVTIDLAAHKVTVETSADAEKVKAALAAAGYPAQAA
jgi:copper chaperone